MSNPVVPIAVGTGLAVVAGAVSAPVAVGASLAVVAGAVAGGIAEGSDVAVGRACDACGVARVGEWGPRTGAVLAAPRRYATKRFGSGSGEYEREFAKGRSTAFADCRRGMFRNWIKGEVSAAFHDGYTKGIKECGLAEGEVKAQMFSDTPGARPVTSRPEFAAPTGFASSATQDWRRW